MTSKLLTGISAVVQAPVVVRIPGCAWPKPRLTLTDPGRIEASYAGLHFAPNQASHLFLSNQYEWLPNFESCATLHQSTGSRLNRQFESASSS